MIFVSPGGINLGLALHTFRRHVDSVGRPFVSHPLLYTDITNHRRYDSRLRKQWGNFGELERLNATIRAVSGALVSATSREGIHEVVCEQLAASDIYAAACVADLATWKGEASRWTTANVRNDLELPDLSAEAAEQSTANTPPKEIRLDAMELQSWTIVPIAYGQTVYGILGVCTDRDAVAPPERNGLLELGQVVGYAIDAVENRQLLNAERIVEVKLETPIGDCALGAVARQTDCTLDLEALVPAGKEEAIAYLGVSDGRPEQIRDALAERTGDSVRIIRNGDGEGFLKWTIHSDELLQCLDNNGAHVCTATADGSGTRYTVEVHSDANLRRLLARIQANSPGTELIAKTERARPIDLPTTSDGTVTEALTDRQQEALETAYRAGYFDWPRESTAEEVAEALDITRPTFQAHLRKAERKLVEQLVENDPPR